jgi:hypothetical protein
VVSSLEAGQNSSNESPALKRLTLPDEGAELVQRALLHVKIRFYIGVGRFDTLVAERECNDSDVDPRLQKMQGRCMTNHVGR